MHITTKAHRPLIEQLSSIETLEASKILKNVLLRYDGLFGFPMPYLLVHHQAKSNDSTDASYHWHIEIYPPYRTSEKLKYLAGVESGAGLFVNDTIPEESAQRLRNVPIKD